MRQARRMAGVSLLLAPLLLLMVSASSVSVASQTEPSDPSMVLNTETQEFITAFRQNLKELKKIWKGKNICTWKGVVCDSAKNEVHLVLADDRLKGTIPPANGRYNLSLVRVASVNMMGVSKLTGPFPEHWGGLPLLRGIVLNSTGLSGTIPSSWGRLKTLVAVDVSNTRACGSFPDWSSSMMPSLQYLNLAGNRRMQGTLSREFGSFGSRYLQLGLSGTNFCGCTPDTWVGDSLRLAVQQLPAVASQNCGTSNKCTAASMLCKNAASTTSVYTAWMLAMTLVVLWCTL